MVLDPAADDRVFIDANSAFVLSWEAPGGDPAAVLGRMSGGILKAQARDKRPHTDIDGLTDAEYEAGINAQVAERIAKLAEHLTGKAFFLRLTVDDTPFLLAADTTVKADWLVPGFSLDLYPIAAGTGLPLIERYGTGLGPAAAGEPG